LPFAAGLVIPAVAGLEIVARIQRAPVNPDGLLHWGVKIGGFALVVAAVAYLVFPLVVKFTMFLRAGSQYQPLSREQLPADVMTFMDNVVWAVQPLGFVPAVLLREVGAAPNTSIYVVLMPNASTADRCTASFTIGETEGEVGGRRLTTPVITFETQFHDDTAVSTSNFADAGVFPPNPGVNRLAIPGLTDVNLLCEIHRRRRARVPAWKKPVLPAPGQEWASQVEEDAREKERVREAGYYSLDEAAGKYVPTWKGAYLMTWKLLFPVSRIRRRAKRAGAKRELVELGLDPALLDRPMGQSHAAATAGRAP
jgi:hypothetical protein